MRKIIGLGLLLCWAYNLFGQEMIPNQGFEIADQNPSDLAEFHYIKEWFNPNTEKNKNNQIGTPDFFSTKGSGKALIPSEEEPVKPYEGNNVVGISCKGSSANYREYFSCRLNDSLIPGAIYHIVFYVKRNDHDYCPFAVSNIGLFFSQSPITQTETNVLEVNPQLEIKDVVKSSEWIEVEFAYKAEAAYKYMTVGCFRKDNDIIIEKVNKSSSKTVAYYYFDLFSMEKIKDPEMPIAKISLPVDISGRTVDVQNLVEVEDNEIEILLYDSQKEDGDQVSLFFNGRWYKENINVTNVGEKFKLNLYGETDNYLSLHAINLGAVPPNTATLKYRTKSGKEQEIKLSSTYEKTATVIFRKKKARTITKNHLPPN